MTAGDEPRPELTPSMREMLRAAREFEAKHPEVYALTRACRTNSDALAAAIVADDVREAERLTHWFCQAALNAAETVRACCRTLEHMIPSCATQEHQDILRRRISDFQRIASGNDVEPPESTVRFRL